MLSPTSSKERLDMTALGISPSIRDIHRGDLFYDDATDFTVADRRRGLVRGLWSAARPHQWIKNIAVLIVPGLMFLTIGFHGAATALIATLAFCLAASSVYLLNDIVDRDQDRLHPVKRNRPIASGLIRPAEALGAAAVLAGSSLLLAGVVSSALVATIAAYLVLTGAYSLRLKRVAYVDVLVLAAGFVLRVVAGAVAVHAAAPLLLLVTVLAGASFLAFGKRRAELMLLGEKATAHRSALGRYHLRTLDAVTRSVEVLTVLAFGLWILVTTGSDLGLVLGLVAAGGLGQVLETQRLATLRGRGGNPTRDLTSNIAVLPGLAIAAFVALSTGVIR